MGTKMSTKKTYFTQHIFIILFCFSLSMPSLADQSDWGLVERFNKQLSAATSGKTSAMYDVAKLYERGRGVEINLGKAVQWYTKAADAGDAEAKSRLGIMYFEGRGVKQDYNKALRMLNAAVKENVAGAQHQLASMYELGTGVPKNIKKAILWYTQAEKNGYYLASGKLVRLKKLLYTGISSNKTKTSKVKSTYVKAKVRPTALMQSIANGHWFKRKKSVGYLPSNITNCVNDAFNSLHCISNAQERSTGSEIITYNTESKIKLKNNKSFEITYSNNVLNVSILQVEDGNGNLIEQTPSRIKKGRQGKKRKLSCHIVSSNTLSCSKGSGSFKLTSR